MEEDWEVLKTFLPPDWRELAQETGALKGLRKEKSVDNPTEWARHEAASG